MEYSRAEPQYLSNTKMLKCIVFDTSALLMMFESGIRLTEEISEIVGLFIPVVTIPVVMELKILSRSNRSIARISMNTLDYVLKKFSIADAQGSADDSVVEVASKYNCIAVTCDNKLKRRLKSLGVHVIYYRKSSSRFEIDLS